MDLGFFLDMVVLVAFFGFLGSTVGIPILLWLIAKIFRKRLLYPETISLARDPFTIDLLVAAHNEEALIGQTLKSLLESRDRLSARCRQSGQASPRIRIRVGLDHCSDGTARAVTELGASNLELTENPGLRGKWNVIQHLVRSSDADWVALVDVGSIWDGDLLAEVSTLFRRQDVIGIAPCYQPAKAGLLERLNWHLEKSLKTVESISGGPVSVHGATVFYRRTHLQTALDALKSKTWLNDDVVIPLALRTLWPKNRIAYLAKPGTGAWVSDIGALSDPKREFTRRKRILLGNLQWIRSLYWKSVRSSGLVGLIASRRVLRSFWAYWFFLPLLVLILLEPHHYLLTGALGLGLSPLPGWGFRLRAAFFAGLLIPFQLLFSAENQEEIWS